MVKVPAVPTLNVVLFPLVMAGATPTSMVLLVPVTAALTVSVAVMVWLPDVFKVALNIPAPLASVLFAGKTAEAAVVVKWIVPA
jgi:hypothetical protein